MWKISLIDDSFSSNYGYATTEKYKDQNYSQGQTILTMITILKDLRFSLISKDELYDALMARSEPKKFFSATDMERAFNYLFDEKKLTLNISHIRADWTNFFILEERRLGVSNLEIRGPAACLLVSISNQILEAMNKKLTVHRAVQFLLSKSNDKEQVNGDEFVDATLDAVFSSVADSE